MERRGTWVVILRRVRGGIHRVVMVGIGSRNGHRPVSSCAGRMREHAGRAIPTGREIPARDHAGDFRGRQVSNAWVSREVRRVIRHGAIRERRRRTGIVIGARKRIVRLQGFISALVRVYLFLRSRLRLHLGSVRAGLEGIVDQLLDRGI